MNLKTTVTSVLVLTALAACGLAVRAHAGLIDAFRYDNAATAYVTAERLVSQDARLEGQWGLVGACSRSYQGEFSKANPTGLYNPDQSLPHLIVTRDQGSGVTLIQLLNQSASGLNQGPVEVLFHAEQGYATFAQYSYRAGKLNDAVYFLSECRLAGEDLLCAKRFIANKPEKLNPQQRDLHNQIVGYDLYRRF